MITDSELDIEDEVYHHHVLIVDGEESNARLSHAHILEHSPHIHDVDALPGYRLVQQPT